jgi:hypothetical protein
MSVAVAPPALRGNERRRRDVRTRKGNREGSRRTHYSRNISARRDATENENACNEKGETQEEEIN